MIGIKVNVAKETKKQKHLRSHQVSPMVIRKVPQKSLESFLSPGKDRWWQLPIPVVLVYHGPLWKFSPNLWVATGSPSILPPPTKGGRVSTTVDSPRVDNKKSNYFRGGEASWVALFLELQENSVRWLPWRVSDGWSDYDKMRMDFRWPKNYDLKWWWNWWWIIPWDPKPYPKSP